MTICGDGDAFFAWPEVVSAKTRSEPRNERPEHFVDKLSLADLCASLEHAADVLGQKGRRSVENTSAPVVKSSQARHRQ